MTKLPRRNVPFPMGERELVQAGGTSTEEWIRNTREISKILDQIDDNDDGDDGGETNQTVKNAIANRVLTLMGNRVVDHIMSKREHVEIPEGKSLSDFLDEADVPLEYRVNQCFPKGARIIIAAQYKAGKTTLVDCNLVRALVDGGKFLGQFDTEPVEGCVGIIDTEMSARQLRNWLRQSGIKNTDKVVLWSLKGRLSSFDLADPDMLQNWADELRAANICFLVLDCLRPILDQLGLDESRDAGQFLVRYDELLQLADVEESAVVHHMGHTGERTRGDSRLKDWPDVTWRLIRDGGENTDDPRADRFFDAFGRDVDLPQGKLDYTVESHELNYVTGTRRITSKAEKVLPALLDIVRNSTDDPLTGRALRCALEETGLSTNCSRDALALAVKQGRILTEPRAKNALHHYLNPSEKPQV